MRSQAVVQVKDNGVGIPPEMLTEVFDMFTQVNRTLDRAQGGLGNWTITGAASNRAARRHRDGG